MLWLIPLVTAAETVEALPEGWRASPPSSKTFASTTTFDQLSSCSQSWSIYSARTAMVLTLSEGGKVRACREKVAESRDPDGVWSTASRLGMVGRWSRDGDWITFTLRVQEGSCEGTHFSTRPDPDDWKLRCTQVTLPPDAGIPGRPLVCQFTESVYTESLGFEVYGLLPYPGEWIMLGEGAGLSIVQDDTSGWSSMETTFTALKEPPTIGDIVGR